jgi:hypothetical protein
MEFSTDYGKEKQVENPGPFILTAADSYGWNMTKSKHTEVPVPSVERRIEPRAVRLSNHRAEFKFLGVPVYQLKVRDISEKGAGVVVKAGSHFLNLIEVGQELNMKLLSPAEPANPSGHYLSRVQHISKLASGRFKGHLVVGMSMLKKINSY